MIPASTTPLILYFHSEYTEKKYTIFLITIMLLLFLLTVISTLQAVDVRSLSDIDDLTTTFLKVRF